MRRVVVLLCAGLLAACRPQVGPREGPTEDPTVAILDASELPAVQEQPLPDDPMGVTVHRLSNGMTVYISPNPIEPRVTAWVAVRAGSRYDPADSTGLAHYLEHMLFKGTDELGTTDIAREQPHLDRIAELYDELRRPGADSAAILAEIDAETQKSAALAIPNEQSRLFGEMGVTRINAATSYDYTVYIADVPTNRLAQWAQIQAECFADARFRLFLPELESVYEEKNLDLSDPDEGHSEAMWRALYPRHPYGQQTILGSVEHLKTPAYADMVEFFERWYAPNNMAILLAGDVTPEVVPLLEQHFGRMEPRELPPRPAADLAEPQGRVDVPYEAEGERSVRLAWRTVGDAHPDEVALRVLDRVLDNSRSGLLNVELELTQVVPRVGSYHRTYAEAGHFVVWAGARDDQPLDEVESRLREVVEEARAGKFDEPALEAIKLRDEIGRKYQLESNEARADRLLDVYVQRRSWAEAVGDEQRLAAVTAADVTDAARRYLGDDVVVVKREKGTRTVPKLEKPAITPVEIDYSVRSDYARRIEQQPFSPLRAEAVVEGKHYRSGSMPAGPLLAVNNPFHDLFEVRYRLPLGTRREPLLCHALSLWDSSGTATRDAAQLQTELYRLGTSVWTECNSDWSELVVTGVDRNLEASLELVRDWLAAPRVDPAVAEQHRDNTLSARRDRLEEPDWLGWALWNYAVYGDHSPELAVPDNAAIRSARPEALLSLVSGWLDHGHRTLYFGPRGVEELPAVLAMGKDHQALPPIEPSALRRPKTTEILLLHRDLAKANVSVVLPLPTRPAEQRPVAMALNEYYRGPSTALFYQEVREARGLAYHASGGYLLRDRPGDDEGLYADLETQADKVPEALAVALSLLEEPLRPPLVEAASGSLVQRLRSARVHPREVAARVVAWDELGLTEDPRLGYEAVWSGLTVEQLDALVEPTRGAPMTIAIMGHRDRIGRKQLGKTYGRVVELRPSMLFGYGK